MKIIDEKQNQTYEILTLLADDLRDTLITSKLDSAATLGDHAKILNYLTMRMIAEASPRGVQYSTQHNKDRLSLALRAQNQFCRTVMMMDYMEQKAKNGNELKTKDSSNEIKEICHASPSKND